VTYPGKPPGKKKKYGQRGAPAEVGGPQSLGSAISTGVAKARASLDDVSSATKSKVKKFLKRTQGR
jgi:hypothetical protein